MLSDFTLNAYRKLLGYLQERYKIVRFKDLKKTDSQNVLILRHDIDWSLDASLTMAKIEAKMGIGATYFVLLSHKLYNVFDSGQFQKLKSILSLGHEIGLHYDPSVCESYGRPLEETVRFEAKQLRYLMGTEIASIASHNPALGGKALGDLDGYLNVYDPVYSEGFLYISDSCRTWDAERTASLFSNDHPPKVQLLIHPALWQPDICTREQVLQRAFASTRKELRRYLAEWLILWRKNPRVKKYDELYHSGHFPEFLK